MLSHKSLCVCLATALLSAGPVRAISIESLKSPALQFHLSLIEQAPAIGEASGLRPLPAFPYHPHSPGKGHIPGVCPPDSVNAVYSSLPDQPNGNIVIGPPMAGPTYPGTHENPAEASTWTSLDDLAKQDGGEMAPLIRFLRLWAANVTEEDMKEVTDPRFWEQFKGSGGQWYGPGTMKWNEPGFLPWLKKLIEGGRIPATVRLNVLGGGEPGYGAHVNTGVGSDDKYAFKMEIQRGNFARRHVEVGLKRMAQYGGVGILGQTVQEPSASLGDFIHEMRHIYDYIHGIKGSEAGPNLSKIQALLCIDKSKAAAFQDLFKQP